MTESFGLGKHSCGDTRLSCIGCKAPVCPKCMVVCPVGNRCQKCAGAISSHVLAVTPMTMLKVFLASAAVGCGFGFTQGYGFGFWGFFILYAVGVLIGNVIHRINGFKMGPKIIASVAAGVVAGTMFSPMWNPASTRRISSIAPTVAAMKAANQTVPPKQQAQKRWQEFEEAFKAKTGDRFKVRVPLQEGTTTESIWLDVASIKPDHIAGKIVSEPEALTKAKVGDVLNVKKTDVEDWIYKDGAQSIGGFSMHTQNAAAEAAAANQRAAEIYAEQMSQYESAAGGGMMMSGLFNLIIFLLGILTPITGIVPPIRLPFGRY